MSYHTATLGTIKTTAGTANSVNARGLPNARPDPRFPLIPVLLRPSVARLHGRGSPRHPCHHQGRPPWLSPSTAPTLYALETALTTLHAQLALEGLRNAQAFFDTDREALSFILTGAQSDLAELHRSLTADGSAP